MPREVGGWDGRKNMGKTKKVEAQPQEETATEEDLAARVVRLRRALVECVAALEYASSAIAADRSVDEAEEALYAHALYQARKELAP